ncbi:NAD(P)-dependent dehydrogenase (short-subunit alcohol dehydrogenase family) [Rhizobium sp. SJZ105]|uniref:SDR family NAD(P)-dependent oxidoreductase n=1 Tax=Rhizobium sp. SJZ105 TaxID=2572678 RepID=UPI0011A1CF6D|nr:SDR family NAD(P)-dependent oxidoreductase [Rhizobium sp. SJZ105]TWC77228.1 NAD(P)-dependent dehydrogenase (short-subunit alcohol dehydrogenase family) [Rhizobium sp. SJZ105]
MLLKNKVVLVTGAGTGIGAATCRQVVQQGGKVILMGRRADAIEEIASSINCPDAVLASAGDAGSLTDVSRVVADARKRFGGIDAVVACAGTVETGAVLDLADEGWRRQLHSNLDTAYFTAKAALPSLIERKGAFIVMSSIAGLQAMPMTCGYVVAKHAVIGLMRSIAIDYGPSGVRANAVCPGWIRTPMADEEMAPIMERESVTLEGAYAHVTSDTPLRRAGDADEVANLCCFLSSDGARLITGSVMTIDGGSTVVCVPTLKM